MAPPMDSPKRKPKCRIGPRAPPAPGCAEEGEEVGRRRRRGRERRRGGRGTGEDREVRGEAGEPGAREEDRRRLERPADVVAVAVDHADERPGPRAAATPA
jgi:hypothetical protein